MNESMNESKHVYRLIADVAAEVAAVGIGKNQRNTGPGGGYSFRGIDDIYNTVGPIMARHGLVVLPRVLSREVSERTSRGGGALFCVVVEVEFDFVSAHDKSSHTVAIFGEAFDSGDKATNKAMSAAYKYALIEALCIPTQGDNDADATTHEIEAQQALSEEQQIRITILAEEVGADLNALFQYYRVKDMSEVPATAYSKIIRSLKATGGKK